MRLNFLHGIFFVKILAITHISIVDSLGQRTEGNSNFSFEPQISFSAREPSPDFIEINTQIEQLKKESTELEERRKQQNLEKLVKKERKKEKKRKKGSKTNRVTFSDSSEYNSTGMSEIEEANGASSEGPIINSEMLPSEKVLEEEAEERRLEEERKKNREPPIVFKDIDVRYEIFLLN